MSEPQALPVLPAAHARALATLQKDDVEISEVARTVEADPALTTALLRAANSAASSPVNRVAVADRAVMRIGLSATRRIVTGAVVNSSFGELRRAEIDPDELWRHLVACALITDHSWRSDEYRSVAFTAGLLHDIGRMAMAHADPERYARVVQVARTGTPAAEAEREIFGSDHEQWGARVAEEWGLPDTIIEVIGDHHDGSTGLLSRVTRDSRRLAATLGFGDGIIPPSVHEDGEPALDALGRDDTMLLSSLGGAEALRTQVEWFRGTLAAA